MCFATVSVRMIFRHVEATLPKYLEREFGDQIAKGTVRKAIIFSVIVGFPVFLSVFALTLLLVALYYVILFISDISH